MKISFFFIFIALAFTSYKPTSKPNIILIMADDMGYECLGTYGSTAYKTPVLDAMANQGIKFNNCVSQPLCTPSRVKIMTGMYNYRNYDYFGNLSTSEYSFGNLMQEAGYATCIAGKWQLNGAYYKNQIPDWDDNSKPHKFGFDEYCLWQVTHPGGEGGRYADPLIEQNGKTLKRDPLTYGPDIFSDYIMDFMERKKAEPFFIYYPMVLVHDPFVPTPDSKDWLKVSKSDTTYFKDMVAYTDKIVGRINDKLKELGLYDNTIVIFTGDNGTHPTVHTQTRTGNIQGAKGNTIDAGTHVPLIITWPKEIKKSFAYDELIEFSDFFPTFAAVADKKVTTDGKSFLPLLTGDMYTPRETAFVHYDPQWGKNVNKYRNQFVRTKEYKLYPNGNFYKLSNDILEKNPLHNSSLTTAEIKVKAELAKELSKHPMWVAE
ncbi:Arylsulfatase A [Spirosomataceae bacterium TFI 002]|nr:Arylsulfatase A [Spirosomataceae bacterium TFI 002]